MKLQTLVLSTFTLFPLTACLEGDAPEEETLETVESALCIAATTPGTPSQSKLVTSSGSQTILASNYGTSECSRTTVELRNTRHVNVTVPSITNESACTGTRVFATYFYESGGEWVRDEILAESGVWMGTYCREPVINYTVPPVWVKPPDINTPGHWVSLPRDVRVVVSARVMTCTTTSGGLQLCGTSYGQPVRSIGWQ